MCPSPGRDQLSDTFLARSVLQQSCFIEYRFSQRHELGDELFATVAEGASGTQLWTHTVQSVWSVPLFAAFDLETSCHLLDVGNAFFSAVSFCQLRPRQALPVETPSTDGVLPPRVSVFHAPCLLYLLQHRESCSKLNTGDVI